VGKKGSIMMMHKYFITDYRDIPGNITTLRKLFPGFHFKNGQYKATEGTWALSSLEKIDNAYGEPVASKSIKGAIFFPPRDLPEDKQKFLNEQKKKVSKTIKVELVSGVVLELYPATAEPRKVAFSAFDDIEEEGKLVSPYAILAFSLFEKLDKGELKNNDKEVMKLIVMGLEKSYNINLDVFNWLDVFATDDIENIFYACLGIDPEEVKKKVVT
jgi:hypothetical protein